MQDRAEQYRSLIADQTWDVLLVGEIVRRTNWPLAQVLADLAERRDWLWALAVYLRTYEEMTAGQAPPTTPANADALRAAHRHP